jgi:hypothetical protein
MKRAAFSLTVILAERDLEEAASWSIVFRLMRHPWHPFCATMKRAALQPTVKFAQQVLDTMWQQPVPLRTRMKRAAFQPTVNACGARSRGGGILKHRFPSDAASLASFPYQLKFHIP